MAIRTDTGEMSDQAGPLVMTAGCTDPKACQASFAKVMTYDFNVLQVFFYMCLCVEYFNKLPIAAQSSRAMRVSLERTRIPSNEGSVVVVTKTSVETRLCV